jgi:uncharacterized protein
LEARETVDGVTFSVRVQPRSPKEGIAGERAGALLVRLGAAPVEGAANAALVRLLARALGVPGSSLEIVKGERGRDKLLRARGVSVDRVRELATRTGR